MELRIIYQLIAMLEFDTIRHNSTLFAGLPKLSNWAGSPLPKPSPGIPGEGKNTRGSLSDGEKVGRDRPKIVALCRAVSRSHMQAHAPEIAAGFFPGRGFNISFCRRYYVDMGIDAVPVGSKAKKRVRRLRIFTVEQRCLSD
jgi:hypothetical protein